VFAKLSNPEPVEGKTTSRTPFTSEHAAPPDGQGDEVWMALCGQAAVEQDPKRLLDLVREINRLLEARKQRLDGAGVNHRSSPSSPLNSDKK
jgi:hypothetical protein